MAFRPFQDTQLSLGALQDEMSRLIERVWHAGVSTGPFDGQQWAPVVDMFEYADHYTVLVEVPGVDADAVDVAFVGNALTIRGNKSKPDEDAKAARTIRAERRFGTFSRVIELPGDIEADLMSAKCHAGVLEITVPKPESAKPKSVKIKSED